MLAFVAGRVARCPGGMHHQVYMVVIWRGDMWTRPRKRLGG